jgi:hypothetical protein
LALTYEESAALMANGVFRDRIKVACLKYATYIMDEAASVPAHNTRIKWAQNAAITPDAAAMIVQPTVVMDGQVQTDGAEITDLALQTAVETAVNKLI